MPTVNRTEKVEQVMIKYELFKKKMMKMNNETLQTALIIIDDAEGVSHKDFFEIAELLLLVDKMDNWLRKMVDDIHMDKGKES